MDTIYSANTIRRHDNGQVKKKGFTYFAFIKRGSQNSLHYIIIFLLELFCDTVWSQF